MEKGASALKQSIYSYRISSLCMALAAAVALTLLGCSHVNPYYDPLKPHHTAGGFQNNYSQNVEKPFSDFLRWQSDRIRHGLPPAPKVATPVQAADVTFINANAHSGAAMQPAVTWVGHATALVQASGLNVLTDPVFSDRASPVQFAGPKRAQPPGLALAQLPRIDVVVISHNHYDHLDKNTVRGLAEQAGGAPLFIVPLGVKAWIQALGIDHVKELDWWDSVKLGQVEFVFTPVQHWSARGVGDRSQTLWGGWAVFGPDFHWYFSGDTGYSADFVDTQKRFADRQTPALGGGFDLALIAVGAYEPRWFMKEQHVNPAEAVRIHQDLKAKRSLGVHWGTFELTDEPLDQPPQDLAAARGAAGVLADDFFLLAIGQTRKLPKRQQLP
jgi:N-acyl-phosphatidylethanolamine-hydrolysing phospholipase D